jgi:DNA-binding CsgD family transcriptional regulator
MPARLGVLMMLGNFLCAGITHLNANDLALRLSVSKRALDLVNVAVLAINAAGRLVLVNRAATRTLRASQWLSDHDGRLCASPRLHERAVLTCALRNLRRGLASELRLTDRATGQQAVLVTVPFTLALEAVRGPTTIGLLWLLPQLPATDSVALIAKLYQFTHAERRMLERLASENDLGRAAEKLLVSRNTIRTQLKSLFRKTGLHSQITLLALAHRLALLQDNCEKSSEGSPSPTHHPNG